MTTSEAIWSAARQHVFLFSGFILLSAAVAASQVFFGKVQSRWMALMTGVWVLINTGIAVWLSRHIHVPSAEILPRVFGHISTYMWLNVAADLVYGLTALFLLSRKGKHRVMLRGFGKAVLFQAIGLAVLDVVFLIRVMALHRQFLTG